MDLVVEMDGLELYWLPEAHAAYGVWPGTTLTPDGVRAFYVQVERLLTMHRSTSWISNSSDLAIASPATQAVVSGWFASASRAGIVERWAMISPSSAISRLMAKNLIAAAETRGVACAQFPGLAQASAWVLSEQTRRTAAS